MAERNNNNNNNRPRPGQNQHSIRRIFVAFVFALVVALVVALIINFLGGLFPTIMMQPRVVYEELPEYLINNKNIRSVSCVLLENIGYDTADDVKFAITSTDFYQTNEMWPEIMKDYCDINDSDPFRPTYSFEEFGPGAFAWISISAPCENPELDMDGRYDGGAGIIEKEKETTPISVLVIGLGSFLSGFFTYFLVIKFLYH